jgi:SlyX protein
MTGDRANPSNVDKEGAQLEERLAELEIRLAFQDRTIQELNDVVTVQQGMIDRMVRELEALRAHLRSIAPTLVASRSEETPPPHY